MGSGGGRRLAVAIGVGLAGIGSAGCERHRDVALTGPTSTRGIALESVELEQSHDGFRDRCRVVGTIRNESGADQRVTLVFDAIDRRDRAIASAQANIGFVRDGRRADFDALLLDQSDDGYLNDCDRVLRVRLVDVTL